MRLGLGAAPLAALIVLAALALRGAGGGSSSSAPPRPRAVVKVVIPEGETQQGMARIARARGLTGSYLAASAPAAAAARELGFDPQRYGAPPRASLEGFLFPATYELYAGSPASRLVAEQLEAFGERFGPPLMAAARSRHLTPYQLLTVASMVEREAGVPHDRPLVAAVIYNRLRLGMPLGVDATLRYALHDFTGPLTQAQLATNTPYNTRLHKGLPPTPISNPGMEAIEAAAHPANVGYLYYVAAPDGCGESVFSSSYAQFLSDAAAYQRALAAHGGRVPTCHRR